MRERRYVWLGLVAACLLAGASGTARAQRASASDNSVSADTGSFNIAVGLKWSPVRYTRPIGVAVLPTGATATDLYGWQTTSLDSYLGFFFHPQIGIILALDLGYSTDSVSNVGPTVNSSTSISYFQFGFALGGKFYLTRPTGLRVSPYLYVDFFKYFASISTSTNVMVNGDQVGFIAGLHSPLGFNLAFGAEYFFTNSFSLGAEVLGLRLAYVHGDVQTAADGTRLSENQTYFTLYTAISLNYRFLAQASVRLEAEAEDSDNPRPARRKARRPPPPPTETDPDQPPPSSGNPESVD